MLTVYTNCLLQFKPVIRIGQDIIRAILDDTLPPHVTLFKLASNTPKLWDEQRKIVWGKHESDNE